MKSARRCWSQWRASRMSGVFDMDYLDYLARSTYDACLANFEANKELFQKYLEEQTVKEKKNLKSEIKEAKET